MIEEYFFGITVVAKILATPVNWVVFREKVFIATLGLSKEQKKLILSLAKKKNVFLFRVLSWSI